MERYPRMKPTREQLRQRAEFTRIQRRLARLIQWLDVEVPRADCTISVDLADLHMKCEQIRNVIERLARTPLRDANRPGIAKKLGRLWVEVENIPMFHFDLVGPVDRMWLAVRRKNERARRRSKAEQRRT